jgi:hypothetical protein
MPLSTRRKRYVDPSGANIEPDAADCLPSRKKHGRPISGREFKSLTLGFQRNKDTIVKVEKWSPVPSTSQRSEDVKKSTIIEPDAVDCLPPRKKHGNAISGRELKSVMLDSEINKDTIVKVKKGSPVPSTSQRSEDVKKSTIIEPDAADCLPSRKTYGRPISSREMKSLMLGSEINQDTIVKVEKWSPVPSTSRRSERVKKSNIQNPKCDGQEKKSGRRGKITEGAANCDPDDREAAAMKLVEGTELKPADLTEILAVYKNGVNVLTSADPEPNDKLRLEHAKVKQSEGTSQQSAGFNYKGASKWLDQYIEWVRKFATC